MWRMRIILLNVCCVLSVGALFWMRPMQLLRAPSAHNSPAISNTTEDVNRVIASDPLAVGLFTNPGLAHSYARFEVGTLDDMMDTPRIDNVLGVSSDRWSPVLVLSGQASPKRRNADQPFLSMSPGASNIAAAAINGIVEKIEGALGRRMFPLNVSVVDMHAAYPGLRGSLPAAIYEVETGTILLEESYFANFSSSAQLRHTISAVGEQLFDKIFSRLAQARDGKEPLPAPTSIVTAAAAAAVAIAVLPSVPLWFCIACPVVLGLLAPIIINFGLGEVMGAVCSHYQLPDEECFDLMLGVLAVGYLLSLASAWPIFKVCRLYECSHRPMAPTA